MGYVEDIQKVNDLARELLNHHMADSLTEAVEKARQMLNKNDIPSVSGDGSVRPAEEKKEEIKVEEVKEPMVSQRMNNDEWKQVLAKNNEYIVEQFKLMKGKLDEAFKEIEKLKEEVKNMDPPLKQLMTEPEKKEQPVQQTIAKPEKKEEDSHPRQGNFGSEDVSIDKIFYFGQK